MTPQGQVLYLAEKRACRRFPRLASPDLFSGVARTFQVFEPMGRDDASLFFQLDSYRYMRGETAITTNKSVKDWPGIFAGDEAMMAAILDRLLHKSVVINGRGRSYRLQDLETLLK